MSDLTAAKSWTVTGDVAPTGRVSFRTVGEPGIDIGTVSPIEQLLGAVCSCFGQTCLALMQFHGLAPVGLRVVCHGHKPAGSLVGKGLDQLRLDISFAGSLNGREPRIIDDAKKLCTVTNSLSKDIAVSVALTDGIAA
ncbi:hypothetical protein GCM10009087_19970 [Sphingomonas oligophenolica]|uniref:OsmC family protein n=1 Tax=Sphingomonas oligophenolica TaxID=301154 RepID=A0ABU9YAR1_9SPHN